MCGIFTGALIDALHHGGRSGDGVIRFPSLLPMLKISPPNLAEPYNLERQATTLLL